MIYLEQFSFAPMDQEDNFLSGIRRTCYDSFYPFRVLSARRFGQIDLEPITILYGGNGSGKTTALNIIAETLHLKRESVYNRSNFFEDYTQMCQSTLRGKIPENSQIITSDDVFDYMLNIRSINEGIDLKREDLFGEYLNLKYTPFQLKSLDDYEKLKQVNLSRRKTQSKFVRGTLPDNIRECSNGENAFQYFTDKIEEYALYLLDEPENSLSPPRQLELADFLYNAARFFGCQFLISTHSPFMLSMKGAKIYDLDEDPVNVKRWTELGNVRTYYDFFKEHEHEFE